MLSKKRTALIAVAKDESAYIHEWIHHHLYFHFDYIYIGINRTSDKTEQLVQLISNGYPNVKFLPVDWIDQISIGPTHEMQRATYAYLTQVASKESDPDYFMYLDIDEFWFSTRHDSIADFILSKENFDIVSFHWLNQDAEREAFNPPFKDVFYSYNPHVTSMISKCDVQAGSCRSH